MRRDEARQVLLAAGASEDDLLRLLPGPTDNLRDEMAGKVMGGLVANGHKPLDDDAMIHNAEWSYRMADAMMAARVVQ